MTINSVASVRTGIVTGRKKVQVEGDVGIQYRMLNLKCIEPDGRLNLSYVESYYAKEQLNPGFLTGKGDVLVRLSFPYTSALINEQEMCGLLVPSHFAIIRSENEKLLPEYLLWFLRRESTYQLILQNSSGSSAFGTISSGFIGSLNIRALPLEQQKALGQLQLLLIREQDLLRRLAEEKAKYNKEALNIIYERFKGEE